MQNQSNTFLNLYLGKGGELTILNQAEQYTDNILNFMAHLNYEVISLSVII